MEIRDSVVKYIDEINYKSEIPKNKIIKMIGIRRGKYYEWSNRMSVANNHNKDIPRSHWLTPTEIAAIQEYAINNYSDNSYYSRIGYRRLTYMMMNEGIVYVSPSTVYRVLSSMGILNRWSTKKTNKKGNGYIQPTRPHQEWHTDIKYVNFKGNFLFFIGVLDGYSRSIIHFELRTNMTEYDVEVTIERAREKYPNEKPRIITDNGSQYLSKDFQMYLKEVGLQNIRTSIMYPQSNGKIERFHRTLNEECLKTKIMLSLEDSREVIGKYVEYYNTVRLHSSLYYLTPEDFLLGRVDAKLSVRERNIKKATKEREEYWSKQNAA